MKYETQILEAFERLGFKPRDNQVEHCDRIITAFLDEGNTNVVLSAPTGTGKSIIGVVVAEIVHSLSLPSQNNGASFMLTATNVLADQYNSTFGGKEDDKFLVVKGASNYACEAMSTAEEPARADSCAIVMLRKSGMADIIDKYCTSCEFRLMREGRKAARHLITNYSYYFIDRMYATYPMDKRTLAVFDEAHLLNDLFVDHNAIYFSEKRLMSYELEVAELVDGDVGFHRIRKALVQGEINDDTYEKHLKELMSVYMSVADALKAKADRSLKQAAKYMKLSRASKKYADLACKIDDLFIFEYPHVFEWKKKDIKKGQNENEITVKPIFVGEMFQVLHNAKFNLFMSATVTESYMKRTMVLPEKTKHIRLEPQFPPENKQVVFLRPMALNYSSMKEKETMKKLGATAAEIVKHHTDKGDRGIILAPSFVVTESISEVLRAGGFGKLEIFEHVRGDKLADIVRDFKSYKGGPAVILTPSGFEGLDLPGDLSRYQIIVKAPFGSLGDARIKRIFDQFPDIYSTTALMKIVQGAGRSVRSMDDHATTYMLDTAIQRLWTKNNEWSDEFSTSFASSLNIKDS